MGRKRGVQFRMGGFLRTDDRSGFVRRASDTRKEWTGLLVGKDLWEPRQTQDFVKGVVDNQTVPDARPLPPARFDGPIYVALARPAAIGDTFLYLESVFGFTANDKIGVMLNTGVLFNTTVAGAPSSEGITIARAMPFPASNGNSVVNYEGPGP